LDKKLVSITGPSCSGKTTLVADLIATGKFCEVVSVTSRQKRDGEVVGVSYYFKTRIECEKMIKENEFVEYVTFNGNIYGTTEAELDEKLSSDRTPLIVLEPHGLSHFQAAPNIPLYSIFIDSTQEILTRRFLERFYGEVQKGTARAPKQDLLAYESKRFNGMLNELRDWKKECTWDLYIDHFTESNKESIVSSLVKLFEKDK
jgi:guanylate kinase